MEGLSESVVFRREFGEGGKETSFSMGNDEDGLAGEVIGELREVGEWTGAKAFVYGEDVKEKEVVSITEETCLTGTGKEQEGKS